MFLSPLRIRLPALAPNLLLRHLATNTPVVTSFRDVSFSHKQKLILDEVSFSVRQGSKVTIMGQNGAGKSTIINLLNAKLQASDGDVNVQPKQKIGVSMQTMPIEMRTKTVEEFFRTQFSKSTDPGAKLLSMMNKALKSVHLNAPPNRIISSFSGGQQARLLLAAALITEPTILLLDEPTNNLDVAGISHLTELLRTTPKTCLVISHDETFLNSFTDSVLYLDVFSKKVESYNGDYFFVKSEIMKRMQKENSANARLSKEARKKKEQAGVFANKGGGMRKVAKRMRDKADKLSEDIVSVRREDESLTKFEFPYTSPYDNGPLMEISMLSTRCSSTGDMLHKKLRTGNVRLVKGSRLHIKGPNGIGKTTLLELLVKKTQPGLAVENGVKIGYYRQDFHNFDFESTVIECLETSAGSHSMQEVRKIAARFFLKDKIVLQKVKTLSEGQKALLSLACLVLQRPTVLIMDEPTNHVNFRHLPSVATAVKEFQGAVIVVSHDHEFVDGCDFEEVLDMGYQLEE